jgi:hypothetical protein
MCYLDCPECVHYMCNDLANHLTVCMSLRAEWKPPTFDISASGAGPQTATVISMPPVTTVTAVETIYQVPETVCGTVTKPQIITVTLPTPRTQTTTVIVSPPRTSTVIVYPAQPSTVTVVAVPPVTSTLTVYTMPAPLPSTSSRTVIEIPLTQTMTITKTMGRQARETAAPLSRRSAFTEATCLPCEDNADCEVS